MKSPQSVPLQMAERLRRARRKASATAKPEPVKAIHTQESGDRMAKIKADVGRLREEI